jgi:hypothetical protein
MSQCLTYFETVPPRLSFTIGYRVSSFEGKVAEACRSPLTCIERRD